MSTRPRFRTPAFNIVFFPVRFALIKAIQFFPSDWVSDDRNKSSRVRFSEGVLARASHPYASEGLFSTEKRFSRRLASRSDGRPREGFDCLPLSRRFVFFHQLWSTRIGSRWTFPSQGISASTMWDFSLIFFCGILRMQQYCKNLLWSCTKSCKCSL